MWDTLINELLSPRPDPIHPAFSTQPDVEDGLRPLQEEAIPTLPPGFELPPSDTPSQPPMWMRESFYGLGEEVDPPEEEGEDPQWAVTSKLSGGYGLSGHLLVQDLVDQIRVAFGREDSGTYSIVDTLFDRLMGVCAQLAGFDPDSLDEIQDMLDPLFNAVQLRISSLRAGLTSDDFFVEAGSEPPEVRFGVQKGTGPGLRVNVEEDTLNVLPEWFIRSDRPYPCTVHVVALGSSPQATKEFRGDPCIINLGSCDIHPEQYVCRGGVWYASTTNLGVHYTDTPYRSDFHLSPVSIGLSGLRGGFYYGPDWAFLFFVTAQIHSSLLEAASMWQGRGRAPSHLYPRMLLESVQRRGLVSNQTSLFLRDRANTQAKRSYRGEAYVDCALVEDLLQRPNDMLQGYDFCLHSQRYNPLGLLSPDYQTLLYSKNPLAYLGLRRALAIARDRRKPWVICRTVKPNTSFLEGYAKLESRADFAHTPLELLKPGKSPEMAAYQRAKGDRPDCRLRELGEEE